MAAFEGGSVLSSRRFATFGGGGLWEGLTGFVASASCFISVTFSDLSLWFSKTSERISAEVDFRAGAVGFTCFSTSTFLSFPASCPSARPFNISFELEECLGGGGCVGRFGGFLGTRGE